MKRKIKFRSWIVVDHDNEDNEIREMCYDLAFEEYAPINDLLDGQEYLMQFTGFYDCEGNEIYEGDILGEFVETDEGLIQSNCQVFWSDNHGIWSLDDSFYQDKSISEPLWFELKGYKYKIIGNIYEGVKSE